MKKKVISLESNKYELKLDNFEGPLDLLCYLIDKNKMDIYKVSISDITDQYIQYIKEQEKLNLEIASEFLVMASTLLLIKSKGLLPQEVEEEAELTEEELLRRILEYKKYKEISKLFKERIQIYSKRFYKLPDKVELPKQTLEKEFCMEDIVSKYKNLIKRNEDKKNENAKNIENIAVFDTYTVSEKVKDIFRELVKKPKFVFNKLFSLNEKSKSEVVTAFSGVLELSRRNKIIAEQEQIFGDIVISKKKREKQE
ncbi:MAG TPA: segregation/condensation protein A [Candidatus Scatovivens faecipullorum]|nr:segregation/condensation protein A [Candidatus Scatovivens faecipullorum]